jgi:hypothetical protein
MQMKLMTALMATAALCSGASQALAQQDSDAWDPWEKWSISAGMFVADLDNTVRIGAPGVGFELDLESALGLKNSQTVFRIDGAYRFGNNNRHRLDFTWFDLSRNATRNLEQSIELPDGTVLPIGATVSSEYDLAFYNARYAYSFIKDERIDFAGSLGLHITQLGLFLEEVGGPGTGGDSVTAPLPVLGMRLDVALTPKWYVRSSVEALYLSFDDFTGTIADIMLAGEYRGWENFSLGLGLNAVRMELENDDSMGLDFNGRFRSDFVGLMLYGRAMF